MLPEAAKNRPLFDDPHLVRRRGAALLDAAMLLRHVCEADGPGVTRFCTATGRKASP